ncbi:hypothetical protein [Mycolicibacterium grossiae]|nr:hypothetical protein [Mycolicibacterium grossiae]QEM43548.1 hypothetical protein FZ046_01050 [Mycolicibacterium grossiae]
MSGTSMSKARRVLASAYFLKEGMDKSAMALLLLAVVALITTAVGFLEHQPPLGTAGLSTTLLAWGAALACAIDRITRRQRVVRGSTRALFVQT